MGRSREIATGDVERKGNQSTMPPAKKSKKRCGGKAKKDGGAEIEDPTPITVEEQEPHMDLGFYGKTKSPNSLSVFAALDSVVNDGSEIVVGEDDGGVEFGFDFGKKKKKKSKKKKKGGGMFPLAEEEDDENSEITVNDRVQDEKDGGLDMDFGKKQKSEKKKRSNTSAQEEDDLNKILAELGEGPASSSALPPPVAEKPVQVQSEAVLADAVETAAAKKKKRKRKKEKKAEAEKEEGQAKEEAPAKAKAKAAVGNKKVPKHVREMQEALAKRKEEEERRRSAEEEMLRKEEEERKRRAEEEMLRKEEEERLRQKVAERLAEKAKRRKKEREKGKLLKKKQEGKLLTGKQNEVPMPDASVEVKKRPKYESKKSKQKVVEAGKPRESPLVAAEPEADQDKEDVLSDESQSQEGESEDKVEAKQEQEEAEAVVEDEDEEEWDAKSWDDVSLLATSPFSEDNKEEEDAQPAVKKGASPPVESPKKTAAPHQPAKKTDAEKNATVHEEVMRKNEIANRKQVKASEGRSQKSSGNELRSPICCILGHVDAGKTKLLDCIRRTNVQEGEAGGITQQIGATFFPTEYIRERTKKLKADATLKVPGLLVIDTPGHESFKNLRSRGSSLCDIAVLVVDIMHGLEPQTIESLNLLKSRKTEFIVALNKVDRLYGWRSCPNAPIAKAMKQQSDDVRNEFKMRLTQIITEFKEQGLNTALYYKNKELGETFNIVPTSAISGEGIPDLLLLLIQWVQKTMEKKLTYVDEVECTVMEVKASQGLATTIDVVLVNGCLHKGDQIVVCGSQGPIVTNIKALLTPRPMKELRVKGTYLQHGRIKGAQCAKISAQDLESAIAGTALYVVGPDDDLEYVMEAVMHDMNKVMSRIDKSGEGVHVQASTLGSLEALIEYLKSPAANIPFSGFGIGPVHKKDVMKASVMLEGRKKEYAAILAFDVKITPEARDAAKKYSVPIFEANIIYHLFDQFKTHMDNIQSERKRQNAEDAVFPCLLKINCVIHKKDPILLGVDVFEGILKVGTPFCILSSEFTDIGKIASIEINNKQVPTATRGQNVAIQIVGNTPEEQEQQKKFVQHIEKGDELVSRITRKSIDVLEADYWPVLSKEDRELVFKLKKIFKIL